MVLLTALSQKGSAERAFAASTLSAGPEQAACQHFDHSSSPPPSTEWPRGQGSEWLDLMDWDEQAQEREEEQKK